MRTCPVISKIYLGKVVACEKTVGGGRAGECMGSAAIATGRDFISQRVQVSLQRLGRLGLNIREHCVYAWQCNSLTAHRCCPLKK